MAPRHGISVRVLDRKVKASSLGCPGGAMENSQGPAQPRPWTLRYEPRTPAGCRTVPAPFQGAESPGPVTRGAAALAPGSSPLPLRGRPSLTYRVPRVGSHSDSHAVGFFNTRTGQQEPSR